MSVPPICNLTLLSIEFGFTTATALVTVLSILASTILFLELLANDDRIRVRCLCQAAFNGLLLSGIAVLFTTSVALIGGSEKGSFCIVPPCSVRATL